MSEPWQSPASLGNDDSKETDANSNGEYNSRHRNHTSGSPNDTARRSYSVAELVSVLGADDSNTHLEEELERRVRDFQLAQQKRKQKYGTTNKCGVFGMYAHLANVRIDLEWAEDAAYRRKHNLPYLSWGDFDRQRLKGRNRPWFTYVVLVLCTIMMVVEFAVNDFRVEDMSVNPMLGVSKQTLIDTGGRDTARIVDGEWFRIVTPLILHAGLIHYGINMAVFWFIGAAVEQSHGPLHVVVLFLIPGIGGNILSAIFLPEFVSVGASGGIFGLIGGCVADIWLNWDLLFIRNSDESQHQVFQRNCLAVVMLVAEIAVNILLGLVCPFIDNWAHLGGFVYGLCCAFSTLEPLTVGFFGVNSSAWDNFKLLFVKFFGVVFSVFLIIASSLYLATADPGENPCKGCRYISCVPFPFFTEDKWWYCDDCDFTTATLEQDRDGNYISVKLNCPNGSVVDITGNDLNLSSEDSGSHESVRRNLPSYCRDFCESVSD